MNKNSLRNFSIIAHIDHGKSTLADRLLEETKTLSAKQMKNQVLDSMDLERERGITIKSHPIQMHYKHTDDNSYIFNLIDTPGHVDFTYEVSRSLAACEGALLLVDAAQGVEAQTVSNAYLAIENDLTIIPVINKVDLPSAMTEDVKKQIIELIGCEENDIIRAAEQSQCTEFISSLSDGYDTIIGERGQKLSGGQKQRLAIARAIVRQPDILIFDEATSSVDNKTERLIQKTFMDIKQDRTMIIIAHRLSTIRNCDNIFVIKNSRIHEQGTHDELMKNSNSFYAELWNIQTGKKL
mgnify:CR=1 FL=1